MSEFAIEAAGIPALDGHELVAAPYRFVLGGRTHSMNALLRDRASGRLVAMSWTDGAFDPGLVGRMAFTLAVLDDTVRDEGAPRSAGLVLCEQGDDEVIRTSLAGYNAPIAVIPRYGHRLPGTEESLPWIA